MVDIKKIYFQMFVAKHYRSLFQLLWWKEVKISDEPTGYEMSVHVFALEVFHMEPSATTF